jgi:hypothetical protein
LTILCILVCWAVSVGAAENCRHCHRLTVSGPHGRLSCGACHGDDRQTLTDPAASRHGARGCTGCHRGHDRLFSHVMGTRRSEHAFVARSWGKADPNFFANNCSGCHVTSCLNCHGDDGHALRKPADDRCLACHRGYFVGSDYHGIAPREEHARYQRGAERFDQRGLLMASDVHVRAGLTCGSCHDMASLAAGRPTAKGCRDCHTPKSTVIEHRISAHLETMECFACHSAWAPQEYGTFWLRFRESPSIADFDLTTRRGEYLKSVFLKRQDMPPLGLNARGRVSPVRPQFIAYYTELYRDRPREENRLMAAEWRAFFPHTIQRGSVWCDDCHMNPRRFLLEPARDRLYDLRMGGMGLDSFWDRRGQTVMNGAFLPPERVRRLSGNSPAYRRAYVEKWQTFVNRVAPSSAP